MKRKLLLALVFASILSASSHAQSDVSDLLFESSIDDVILQTNTTIDKVPSVIPCKTTVAPKKTKDKEDIDKFIEQAIEKARKEEEKKQTDKKKAEEKKKQEKTKKAKEKTSEDTKNMYLTKTSDTDITGYAKTLLGIPYVWGGTNSDGFDCSGFVQAVYNKFNMNLSRTTHTQIKQGYSVALSDIKENDLVFFDTRSASVITKLNTVSEPSDMIDIIIDEKEKVTKKLYPTEPTHVGLYIGDGKIIHASSSKGQTVIDALDNGYFKDRIVDVRRYK